MVKSTKELCEPYNGEMITFDKKKHNIGESSYFTQLRPHERTQLYPY